MKYKERTIILFPEYHLTDFPPQFTLSQEQASGICRTMNVPKADLFIAGYAESEGDKTYSSCLVQDGNKEYNLRKKYPFKDELNIISGGDRARRVLPLTIGRTYIFLCNDLTVELDEPTFYQFILSNDVKVLVLISAMSMNFEKWKKRMVDLGLITIICDRFNGTMMVDQLSNKASEMISDI